MSRQTNVRCTPHAERLRKMRCLGKCHRRRAGLTLLEVLLTLAIMTVLAAFALPRLDGMLGGRRLVRGAEVVRVQMMRARLQAMRTGRTHMMQCPVNGTAITTYAIQNLNDLTEAADQLGSGTALLQGGQPMAASMQSGPETGQETQSVELPEDIKISEVRVQATTRALLIENQTQSMAPANVEEGQPSQPILFYPDGTTSNAAVIVTQATEGTEGGARIVVVLRGLTGDATVGDPIQ
ncbi:hypothetical protein FF011L_17370 [Roseimaritima multifibrata]|uniref:General secretion pathway GspH domain-containing protein n=1 Tax=Roseimaritima multifibrata TaxID=1930274 RepID=A0A517MDM5_9BACT|nr:prepilin-type N-terminal cleavage/methylation domain-containing protein [Roseimaritima multifibrata]QDS92982.1 hypothetical protein FF011L_17370 [Roseimaritima multifibrata]